MIHNDLAIVASETINELYGTDTDPSMVTIEVTPEHFEGDFTIVLFPFLKISKKNPHLTGEEIGEMLCKKMPWIEFSNVVKGYLNIKLSASFWLNFFQEASTIDQYGFQPVDFKNPPVVIEFSSPNTNKPLHLGHIRNNILGFSVSSILESTGKRVKRVNLVNDRGIHICKSMVGWMRFGKGLTPSITGIKGDRFVGDYYVAFDKALKEELNELKTSGMAPEDADKNSKLMLEARNLLRLWEESEPQTRALWKEMNNWVYTGFDTTYKRLGISFDRVYYESDTYLDGKAVVHEGVEKGLLDERHDNSVWIDLTDKGLDQKLLLRSDGTSVYITQDLGTAIIRNREFAPERMIYVVGNEQNYHFEVLVSILDHLGYKDVAGKVVHLSYGMVELPSGKMKSREGNVVDADDLMDEMRDTARKVTSELGKWTEEELTEMDDLFEIIGSGALKYFILKVDPRKNMLFNPEESIDFNGNTGPFIQYTHARIASLIRKADELKIEFINMPVYDDYPLNENEKLIIRHLYRWPDVLKESAEKLNPAYIANFSYDLARSFNQFYNSHSVLNNDTILQTIFRLKLSEFTGRILRNAMGLLGIKLPDQM